jgi:hypothetical protein
VEQDIVWKRIKLGSGRENIFHQHTPARVKFASRERQKQNNSPPRGEPSEGKSLYVPNNKEAEKNDPELLSENSSG